MEDFKIYHRKGRYRRDAVARRGGIRLRQHDVRRGHALADGRIADGAAGARRNVDEITGAVTAMRRQECCGSRLPLVPSMWSAPAATAPARSMSRPVPRSSSPAAACRCKTRQSPLSSRSGCRRAVLARGQNRHHAPRMSAAASPSRIGFMFAPSHHPAMKNVGPTRVELAHPDRSSICSDRCPIGPASSDKWSGVFRQWVQPLAQVLKNLGAESSGWYHGSDGLDEITLTARPSSQPSRTAISEL